MMRVTLPNGTKYVVILIDQLKERKLAPLTAYLEERIAQLDPAIAQIVVQHADSPTDVSKLILEELFRRYVHKFTMYTHQAIKSYHLAAIEVKDE
jgi:hypothetical protein